MIRACHTRGVCAAALQALKADVPPGVDDSKRRLVEPSDLPKVVDQIKERLEALAGLKLLGDQIHQCIQLLLEAKAAIGGRHEIRTAQKAIDALDELGPVLDAWKPIPPPPGVEEYLRR